MLDFGVFVDLVSGSGWQIDETALMTPSTEPVPAKWKRQPAPVKREKATTSPGDAWQAR